MINTTLTSDEVQVIKLRAQGVSLKDIAKKMGGKSPSWIGEIYKRAELKLYYRTEPYK